MGKDTSGIVVIALSVIMLLVGGYMAWTAHQKNADEANGYKIQIEKAQAKLDKQYKQVREYETTVKVLTKLSGWGKFRMVGKDGQEIWVEADNSKVGSIDSTLDQYLKLLKDMAERYPEWAGSMAANERIDFKTMNSWKEVANVPLGDFLTADKLVRSLKRLEEHLTKETDRLIRERDEARAEEDKLIGERGEQARKEKELKDKISNQRKENEGIMARIKEQATQKKDEVVALDRSIQEILEKIGEVRQKGEENVNNLRKGLANVKDRIDKFQQRAELARSSTEADGRVTHSLPSQNYAWIDLGSKHTLLVGTRFEVFGLDKGGKKVPKGEVEVLKVWEDQAQVAILKTHNTLRPIEGGDYINNEVFDRNKTKVFAFAGRFAGRYSNEEAKKKIEEIGGKVVEEATLETAYVVVGKDYESDPNYARAQDWGIIIIREKDLYELMGIR